MTGNGSDSGCTCEHSHRSALCPLHGAQLCADIEANDERALELHASLVTAIRLAWHIAPADLTAEWLTLADQAARAAVLWLLAMLHPLEPEPEVELVIVAGSACLICMHPVGEHLLVCDDCAAQHGWGDST